LKDHPKKLAINTKASDSTAKDNSQSMNSPTRQSTASGLKELPNGSRSRRRSVTEDIYEEIPIL